MIAIIKCFILLYICQFVISIRFQNGVSAPHMLGNQLNPTSTMAQKMSDTLTQELEAHSIFTEASNPTTNLVGPQLHSRVIASVGIFEIK